MSSAAAARKQLRNLHDNVLANKAEYTSTASSKLGEVLDTANGLYTVTKEDTRGAAIDASFLHTTSMLGAEQAGNLEKVTPEKYIGKLKAAFGYRAQQAVKWHELAAAVHGAEIFNPVPAPLFVSGRYEAPEKKERKERKRKDAAASSCHLTACCAR